MTALRWYRIPHPTSPGAVYLTPYAAAVYAQREGLRLEPITSEEAARLIGEGVVLLAEVTAMDQERVQTESAMVS